MLSPNPKGELMGKAYRCPSSLGYAGLVVSTITRLRNAIVYSLNQVII
jgi:hypothetical protein